MAGSNVGVQRGVPGGVFGVRAVVHTGIVPAASLVKVIEAICGLDEPPHPGIAVRTRANTDNARMRDMRSLFCAPLQYAVVKKSPE
jgi:hypothetical protein